MPISHSAEPSFEQSVQDQEAERCRWEALAQSFHDQATTAQLEDWAAQFSTTVPILRRLRVGCDTQRHVMTIPERLADGTIVGIATRTASGEKFCIKESKRGLTFLFPNELQKDDIILIVEGATDVMAGEALGLPRVSVVGRPSAMGAFDELLKLPRHCRFVVCGENDLGAGILSAGKLARHLTDNSRRVKVIFPPKPIKDLRAWAASGNAAAVGQAIMKAIEQAPWRGNADPSAQSGAACSAHLNITASSLSTFESREIQWLWNGRFALGKLALLSGHPGVGKSTLMIDLASRISAGLPMPDGQPYTGESRKVLLISGEDDPADTIRPRVEAAGGDVNNILIHCGVRDARKGSNESLSLREHAGALSRFIGEHGPFAMVVVDPISAYMGTTDTHNNTDVRATLLPLAEMAQQHGCAFVGVTHLNKSGDKSKAILRSMGSLAFVAAARTVFLVFEDDKEKGRKLFVMGKSNIAQEPPGLAYRIVHDESEGAGGDQDSASNATVSAVGRIEWETTALNLSADEVLRDHAREEAGQGDMQIQNACNLLFEMLGSGPREAKHIQAAAREAGISDKTLQRAKAELAIESTRGQGSPIRWMWSLPGMR